MPDIILNHPVHTLEKELLLPAGTELSTENLKSFFLVKNSIQFESHPMSSYGSIRDDLEKFLTALSYKTIIIDQEQIRSVLSLAESVRLPIPVLQSLDYFGKHDYYTYRHFLIVFALSTIIAKELLPDSPNRGLLAGAGPTHDIGKVCVPIGILKKNTPLTLSELSILENHTAAGCVLLSFYLKDMDNLAVRIARDHHERNNGSGYPRGIILNELLIEIIAVSDVYDALISPRPYRPKSYDKRTAIEDITARAEKGEFSWDVVKALIALHRKSKPHYSETKVSDEKRGVPPSDNLYRITKDDEPA